MNLFQFSGGLPAGEERIDVIVQNGAVRIERIVSAGQKSGWYCQQQEEAVCLLSGHAALEYEGGRVRRLSAGDTVIIPAGEKHRVCETSVQPPCVWLCIFYHTSSGSS